jgi:aspartate/methionine/tyrosine aminotransferase
MAAAQRFDQIQTPVIPEMAQLIAATPGTLSLGQGVAPWAPPEEVLQAMAAALRNDPDLHRYGPVAGDPELRAELRHWLEQQHQIDCSASEILITAGSNMAFQAVVQALCDPGDEVILPVPYYFNHEMAVRIAGGHPRAVEAGVIPDPALLEEAITERTRAIVTVSPNNPSGAIVPRPVLAAINQLCARRGLIHISDEAYALFHYGAERPWSPGAAAGSGGHTITLGSLSKSHGMAGYRIGWAVVPPPLMSALTKVQDTSLIGPPKLNQWAARAALAVGPQWCREQIQTLAERREQVLAALGPADPKRPWRLVNQPEGAFYALLELDSILSADQVMKRLIVDHQVALASGSSFGLKGACLRLSYGMLSGDDLAEALRRLERGLLALS